MLKKIALLVVMFALPLGAMAQASAFISSLKFLWIPRNLSVLKL